MKRNVLIIVALLVVIVTVVTGFIVSEAKVTFDGSRVKNENSYLLDFKKMNKVDYHEITLKEGEVLSVDFDVKGGRVDLFIGMDGEDAIYKGNDIEAGFFEVSAPRDGLYRITVRAKHASGYVNVTVKE